ncbi:MAG: MFS transporter, partial [Actinobacteria bacterium]|nr:MFS transporter [Actinomycetota bacterium]
YGWVFSSFMLADLVGLTLWGRLADRRGPARSYSAGVALFAAGLVIGGAAPSMAVLVLGRVVQGFGAGALSSTLYVAVGRGYARDAKPRMLATLSTAWVVPGLVGPALAGAVAEHLSWRLVFVGLLPVLGAASALTLPALRGMPPEAGADEARSPFGLAMRLALGAGLALGGLDSRGAARGVVLLAAGAIVGVPALRELLPEGVFRARRGLPAAIAARGLLTFAFFGTDTFIPLGLTSVRHVSPTLAGLALTTASLTWAGGSWFLAHTGKDWDRAKAAGGGMALVLVGIAGVASVLWRSVPVAVAPVAWAVAGAGMGMAYQIGTLVVVEDPPPAQVGLLSASMQLSDVLGVALGTGVAGAAVSLAAAQGWSRALGLAIGHAACGIVGTVALAACLRIRSLSH